jgi:hypothetical protein
MRAATHVALRARGAALRSLGAASGAAPRHASAAAFDPSGPREHVNTTMVDRLVRIAADTPGLPAGQLIDAGGTRSYADLVHGAAALAAGPMAKHVDGKPGREQPRIAFLTGRDHRYALAQWATWLSGGSAVALPEHYPVEVRGRGGGGGGTGGGGGGAAGRPGGTARVPSVCTRVVWPNPPPIHCPRAAWPRPRRSAAHVSCGPADPLPTCRVAPPPSIRCSRVAWPRPRPSTAHVSRGPAHPLPTCRVAPPIHCSRVAWPRPRRSTAHVSRGPAPADPLPTCRMAPPIRCSRVAWPRRSAAHVSRGPAPLQSAAHVSRGPALVDPLVACRLAPPPPTVTYVPPPPPPAPRRQELAYYVDDSRPAVLLASDDPVHAAPLREIGAKRGIPVVTIPALSRDAAAAARRDGVLAQLWEVSGVGGGGADVATWWPPVTRWRSHTHQLRPPPLNRNGSA